MSGAQTRSASGRAMGTTFHILTVGAEPAILDQCLRRLSELEQRWSRFVPDSEVSRINAEPDQFHLVTPDTVELVQRGVEAWKLTSGDFDPTVLDAMVAHGYDRSFERLDSSDRRSSARPAPGCSSIDVDPSIGLVRLGSGVGFDPGGFGKGLAADLLTDEAMAAGAAGVMVNLGGDLVCRGRAPNNDGWVVEIREPAVRPGRLASIAVESGAIATSTVAKRRWSAGSGEHHHLVDPNTGRNTEGLLLASVISSCGWFAEVTATQILVAGDLSVVEPTVAAALAIDAGGLTTTVGPMAEYLR